MVHLRRLAQAILGLLSVTVVCIGVAACGSSQNVAAVARVEGAPVSGMLVKHWMKVVAGGDYVQIFGTAAPAALISDPPDYSGCAAAARTIGPAHPPADRGARPDKASLEADCKQLYESVKLQALSYLLAVQWRVSEGAKFHEAVSASEISRQLQKVKTEQFPHPGEFQQYLRRKGWSIADERYLLKRNLLETKFLARIQREASKLNGSSQASLERLIHQQNVTWTAKTTCSTGYIVWQCKQYSAHPTPAPAAPAILLERMAGISI